MPKKSETTLASEDALIARACTILDKRLRRGPLFERPGDVKNYLKLQLQGHQNEHFAALYMDTKHRMMAYEVLFTGTVDGAEVHPRVIAQRALHHNAAAVVIAHNHPSGDPDPSTADRAITAKIKQTLSLVDVRLLDHFIIGQGDPVSMAARGML